MISPITTTKAGEHMSPSIAIIGGSGLDQLQGLSVQEHHDVTTPYGDPSGPIQIGDLNETAIAFLPRHGSKHDIAPHCINYRANLWALKSIGVNRIIAVAAVGAIARQFTPQSIVLPNQIIDYTYSREHTLYGQDAKALTHVDFTQPFSEELRNALLEAGGALEFELFPEAIYGVTQGPRLETAAEINRMERDGCDVVGMTAMPEAGLARELGMPYALCSLVVNWAAGRGAATITMAEIEHNLEQGMENMRKLLVASISRLS
jgi:5'-methylthioinosine phosphorylase